MALLLTLDELVRAKCHPLTETGDHEGVRNGKETEVLAEREVLRVQEDDRLVRESRESRVEVRDDVSDGALGLVLLGRLKRDLDEDHLALILGVLVQECLEGLYLEAHSLDSVQLVASDDELHPCVTLFQGLDPFHDLWFSPIHYHQYKREFQALIETHFLAVMLLTSIPMGNTPTSTKRSSSWTPFGSASAERIRLTV